MTTSTPEKTDGLKALNDAIVAIKAKIVELGGVFNIQMAVSISYHFLFLAIQKVGFSVGNFEMSTKDKMPEIS